MALLDLDCKCLIDFMCMSLCNSNRLEWDSIRIKLIKLS